MKFINLIAGPLLLILVSSSFAAPLTLNYQVSDLGDIYRYDFELVLDNTDNSWIEGQSWNWIVFGDWRGNFYDPPTIMCEEWSWLSITSGFSTGCSYGSHQGPMVYAGDSPGDVGWVPSSVGESIRWSGTYHQFIGLSDMWWSPVVGSDLTKIGAFYRAGTMSLPEPSPFLLLGAGLIMLRSFRRAI